LPEVKPVLKNSHYFFELVFFVKKFKSKGATHMKSIKTKLVLYISILLILSLGTMGGITLYRAVGAIESEAIDGLVRLSEEAAHTTTVQVEKQMIALEMIAGRSDMETMDWNAQKKILQNQVERTGFLSFAVVDLKGNAVFNDGAEANVADRTYFKSALEGETVVSDMLISRLTEKPELVYATPIMNNGKVVGVLIARRDGYVLSNITDTLGYGASGYAYMVNREGTVVAHPDRTRVEALQNPINESESNEVLRPVAELFRTILNEKEGYNQYEFNDTKLVASYFPVEGTDWTLIITANESEVLKNVPRIVRSIMITMGVALLVSVIFAYLLGNNIANPIIEVVGNALKIAELDIRDNIEMKIVNRKDEVGKLGSSLQTIIVSMRSIMADINASSEQVTASSEELTATAGQSARAIEEIAKAIEEIARGASDQAKNTEVGSVKGTQLGETMANDQKEMQHLNLASDKVSKLVDEGLIEIDSLTKIAKESNDATQIVQQGIMKTNTSAKKIEAASQVIASIADQTNLLALNAAIEAARAGEAGRGFAVVADEIRKLAEQSSSSTSTIDEVVSELQTNSNDAVRVMERVLAIMKEQSLSVEVTQNKYIEISGAIKKSEDAVQALNQSSIEMDNMKDQIMDTLVNLASIAEENSASTEEVSAAVEEQNASMEEIASASEGLAELAQNLQNIIMKFKI
jgi:methyl-accepting chemotaxis protein